MLYNLSLLWDITLDKVKHIFVTSALVAGTSNITNSVASPYITHKHLEEQNEHD